MAFAEDKAKMPHAVEVEGMGILSRKEGQKKEEDSAIPSREGAPLPKIESELHKLAPRPSPQLSADQGSSDSSFKALTIGKANILGTFKGEEGKEQASIRIRLPGGLPKEIPYGQRETKTGQQQQDAAATSCKQHKTELTTTPRAGAGDIQPASQPVNQPARKTDTIPLDTLTITNMGQDSQIAPDDEEYFKPTYIRRFQSSIPKATTARTGEPSCVLKGSTPRSGIRLPPDPDDLMLFDEDWRR
ncbi:MAG: hypothetical protein Q9219_003924 [cf. Caloplaca sp. 3 TL-2023]